MLRPVRYCFDKFPQMKRLFRPFVRGVIAAYYWFLRNEEKFVRFCFEYIYNIYKFSLYIFKYIFRPFVRAGFKFYFFLKSKFKIQYSVASNSVIQVYSPMIPFAENGENIGQSPYGREIVMLVVSDLRIDPRVEREARSLAAAGYEITVLCPDLTNLPESPKIDWGPGVTIRYLGYSTGEFCSQRPGYLAYDLFKEAARKPVFAIHAHDLTTAYAALGAAHITGAHMVADFHEWMSENVHFDYTAQAYIPYPSDWKADLKRVEGLCFKSASGLVTVCDSIADAMMEEHGGKRRPTVIRNIPSFSSEPSKIYPPLREQLGLEDREFVLLYQGGTGPTRYLEPIIQSLAYAPECTLVIRGPSLDMFGNGYRKLADSLNVSDRLILVPAVPSRDVVAAARGADCGIWTLPALCRNFTYALPNKIFEYLTAGLPILAAHYPEAKRMIETYNVGLTFDPDDPKSIAAAINRMIREPEIRGRYRENVSHALSGIDAGQEWQKLVSLYDSLPRRDPNSITKNEDFEKVLLTLLDERVKGHP